MHFCAGEYKRAAPPGEAPQLASPTPAPGGGLREALLAAAEEPREEQRGSLLPPRRPFYLQSRRDPRRYGTVRYLLPLPGLGCAQAAEGQQDPPGAAGLLAGHGFRGRGSGAPWARRRWAGRSLLFPGERSPRLPAAPPPGSAPRCLWPPPPAASPPPSRPLPAPVPAPAPAPGSLSAAPRRRAPGEGAGPAPPPAPGPRCVRARPRWAPGPRLPPSPAALFPSGGCCGIGSPLRPSPGRRRRRRRRRRRLAPSQGSMLLSASLAGAILTTDAENWCLKLGFGASNLLGLLSVSLLSPSLPKMW